ncbi:MAG: hypothetical protein CMF31_08195 [Kordiimonas sp.]|nr:hypothetical protein [Kordiimonas sp.]
MNYFIDAYRKNYVNFFGVADRAEFWWFTLFLYITYFVLALVDAVLGTAGVLLRLFGGIILLIFACLPSVKIHNQYT